MRASSGVRLLSLFRSLLKNAGRTNSTCSMCATGFVSADFRASADCKMPWQSQRHTFQRAVASRLLSRAGVCARTRAERHLKVCLTSVSATKCADLPTRRASARLYSCARNSFAQSRRTPNHSSLHSPFGRHYEVFLFYLVAHGGIPKRHGRRC